jgi:hypothetical protein
MTCELNVTELDKVSGGASYQENFAKMAELNKSITQAGWVGVLNAQLNGGMFGTTPPGGGGGCHSGCHPG